MKILLAGYEFVNHRLRCGELIYYLERLGHNVSHRIFKLEKFGGTKEEWLESFKAAEKQQEEDLVALIENLPFDALISETGIFAGAAVHKKTQIPWALFGNLPIFHYSERQTFYLQASIPEFELFPPAQNLHFLGPLLPFHTIQRELPDFFPEILAAKRENKPTIIVTQGTIANATPDLLAPTKIACAGRFFCIDWPIQHCYWMPFADVFVTNGGYGGVSTALYYGIPMVVAGETEDKPFVADRVEKVGVGINLRTARPSPGQVSSAIEQVLNDEVMKARCKELSKLSQAASPHAGLAAFEEFVFTRSQDYKCKA